MIFVDEVTSHGHKGKWCHMITDMPLQDELHEMAEKPGLSRSWFEPSSYPHYDLRPDTRESAIKYGAVAVNRRVMAHILRSVKMRNGIIK